MFRGIPWGDDVDGVVEELISMLDSSIPVDIPEGINLNGGRGRAPITFDNLPDGQPWASFQKPNGDILDFSFDGSDLIIDARSSSGESMGSGSAPGSGRSTPTVFFGTVPSSNSVSSYQVTLTSGSTVTAIQQQISGSTAIPNGTSVIVVKEAGVFKMQAPVWL